jgi:hypothetical protein
MGCANNDPAARPSDANGQIEAPCDEQLADASADQAKDVTDDTGAPDAMPADLDASSDGPQLDADSDAASEEVAVDLATWSHIYKELLANMSYASNCTGEGCHSPGVQKGFDLSSQESGYATVQAKLVPGNPDASTIVIELQTGMMPRGARPRMPAADLEVIEAWILGGAAND